MMKKSKILELEALRAIASLYVFFGHALLGLNVLEKSSSYALILRFGQEAVMIFFILSGFVIALSLQKNLYTFSEYFKHSLAQSIYTYPRE